MKSKFICYGSAFFILTVLVYMPVIDSAIVRTDIVYGNNALYDTSASVSCVWILPPNDYDLSTNLYKNDETMVTYVPVRIPPRLQVSDPRYTVSRLENLTKDDDVNITLRFTLEISELRCSDNGLFICVLNHMNQGSPSEQLKANATLRVKVKPGRPNITTIPLSAQGVKEASTISVTCEANAGTALQGGRIDWEVSFDGVNRWEIANAPYQDNVIQVSTRSRPLTDTDPTCSSRIQDTLSIKVNRSMQNLEISCFAVSDITTAHPATCEDTDKILHNCERAGPFSVLYGVSEDTMSINRDPETTIYEGDKVSLVCSASGNPTPVYTWIKAADTFWPMVNAETKDGVSTLVFDNIQEGDSGLYNCSANNTVDGFSYSAMTEISVTVSKRPTTNAPTSPDSGASTSIPGKKEDIKDDDDGDLLAIVLGITIPVILLIIIITAVICIMKRKSKKSEIEEPPEKPYNNRSNLSFVGAQPDLVADDKKFYNASLNNSFDQKSEETLEYANLTYDNRPRSRKPMAIGDTASDYSDIQMPQV